MVWGGELVINHHEMGKCIEKIFEKKLLKPNADSHNNPSWYTDTDEFLEHSPGGRGKPVLTTSGLPSRR